MDDLSFASFEVSSAFQRNERKKRERSSEIERDYSNKSSSTDRVWAVYTANLHHSLGQLKSLLQKAAPSSTRDCRMKDISVFTLTEFTNLNQLTNTRNCLFICQVNYLSLSLDSDWTQTVKRSNGYNSCQSTQGNTAKCGSTHEMCTLR